MERESRRQEVNANNGQPQTSGKNAPSVRAVKIVVEYEGTEFSGFQWQKGRRTVQAELEKALNEVMQEPTRILAAGRTDAGVHATGQVVKFRTKNRMPVSRMPVALNAVLPSDVRVRRAEEVTDAFHPRYDARARVYRYLIDNKPVRSVVMRRLSHHVPRRLDVRVMQQAAQPLVGIHDFAAFEAAGSRERGSSMREVKDIRVRRDGGWVIIWIESNAFLYKMVRNIVGTLIRVGLGEVPVEEVARILRTHDRKKAGPTAPPQGLCLVKVKY